MKDEMIMSIRQDAFIDMCCSFDNVLAAVLKKMKIRDSDQATITLKVDIKLTDLRTVDSRSGEIMHVKNPTISYKVNHKLGYKSDSGEEGQISREDSYLTFEDGRWIIKPVEDGQMTIDDYVKGGNNGGNHSKTT